MKTNPNDSAFAYTYEQEWGSEGQYKRQAVENGLTKREMFAMAAMQGLCSTDMLRDKALHRQLGDENLSIKAITVAAVGIADALIDELNKSTL